MNTITYRKAVLEDCLDLAILKGQVWNTTYRGIYSEEKLSGYDIARNQMKANGYTKFFLSVNSRNYDAQKFYEAMGGVTIYQDDMSIKYSYQV